MRPAKIWIAVGLAASLIATHAASQTQGELDLQEAIKTEKLDDALNVVYQALLTRYSPKHQIALKLAQRSWVKFRDDDCNYESLGVDGGSMRPVIYSQCVQNLTEERTKRLKYQMECHEGDMACVQPSQ